MSSVMTRSRSVHPRIIAVLALLLLTALYGVATDLPHIVVPCGSPVTPDGTIEEVEWEESHLIHVSARCTLHLVHDGEFLYLGIRSGGRGFASPFIVQSDSVRVLHASAALGTASYETINGTWALFSGFDAWACRDAELSPLELSENRAAFLEQHGWIASTGGMGTSNEVEYVIKLQPAPTRMLLLYYDSGSLPRTIAWPEVSAWMALYRQLLDGALPEEMPFRIERWATLQIDVCR